MKILDFLKRIFSKPEDKMSPQWIKENLKNEKVEFHSVCWNWPIIKDF